MAFVVLHEGETATPEEIMAYCKGKIAGFKSPKALPLSRKKRCQDTYRKDPP